MKKLLSLLSVLTISGTSLPTAVAASNYEKNVNTEINNNDLKIEKRGITSNNYTGGINFDINTIWKNRNLNIRRSQYWGPASNNYPDYNEILYALNLANIFKGGDILKRLIENNKIINILNITQISRNSAYISAKSNISFKGGFWVYY